MSSCACSCKMMDECWVVVVYGQWDDEGVVVQVWRMERMGIVLASVERELVA